MITATSASGVFLLAAQFATGFGPHAAVLFVTRQGVQPDWLQSVLAPADDVIGTVLPRLRDGSARSASGQLPSNSNRRLALSITSVRARTSVSVRP